MAALNVSNELAKSIQSEAKERGLSVEEFLKGIVQREKTQAARQQIEQEQKWWLSRPLTERAKFEGEYVAIHNQQVVDHDKDAPTLHKRIRDRYGISPVLVIPTEGPREIHIFSPRLIHE